MWECCDLGRIHVISQMVLYMEMETNDPCTHRFINPSEKYADSGVQYACTAKKKVFLPFGHGRDLKKCFAIGSEWKGP